MPSQSAATFQTVLTVAKVLYVFIWLSCEPGQI